MDEYFNVTIVQIEEHIKAHTKVEMFSKLLFYKLRNSCCLFLLEILRNIEKDMKHETQVLTVISVIMHFLV